MATELTYVLRMHKSLERLLIAEQCPVGARLPEAGTTSPLTANRTLQRY